MSLDFSIDKAQIEIYTLKLQLNQLVPSVRELREIVKDLLDVIIKERRDGAEFKREHEIMFETLKSYQTEIESLRKAFCFRTPQKLEDVFLQECSELSLEDQARLIQKIRTGEFIDIPKPPKKKKGK